MQGRAPAGNTGATALLRAARAVGTTVCFANPGTSEMQLVAALDDVDLGVRPVLCLQENVATGAADGFARMSGDPAIALLHLGPGLANGLANLHNARRARSPVLVVVGDMASWHVQADPVLNMDIAALAATVSCSVLRFQPQAPLPPLHVSGKAPAAVHPPSSRAADAAGSAAASAPAAGAAQQHQPDADPVFQMAVGTGVQGSRVATVIVPHDASWGAAANFPAAQAVGAAAAAMGMGAASSDGMMTQHPGTWAFMQGCVAAIRQQREHGGRVCLYLGGAALASEEALQWAGRIAAITGATLLCEGAFARIERGHGLPALTRLPYFPQEARQALSQYSLLVTVDAKLPVANFGYRGGPSNLVTHLTDACVWELDADLGIGGTQWPAQALKLLATELGATPETVRPGVNCRGAFCMAGRPPLPPAGKLTAQSLCAVVAALQPEGTILVDESLTSGGAYWELSKGCPRFSHLTLTGGAIGIGPALSIGAAVACPDRLVINVQADGSAMYTLQSLWTQAREQLNIITIICDNSSYSILKVECARQRLPPAGPATRSLTSLCNPSLDWVSLAQGMGVPAVRVEAAEQLSQVLAAAIEQRAGAGASHRRGPLLIQAIIP